MGTVKSRTAGSHSAASSHSQIPQQAPSPGGLRRVRQTRTASTASCTSASRGGGQGRMLPVPGAQQPGHTDGGGVPGHKQGADPERPPDGKTQPPPYHQAQHPCDEERHREKYQGHVQRRGQQGHSHERDAHELLPVEPEELRGILRRCGGLGYMQCICCSVHVRRGIFGAGRDLRLIVCVRAGGRVRSALHQLVQRHAENLAQPHQLVQIRHAGIRLPLAHRLPGDTQPLRQGILA